VTAAEVVERAPAKINLVLRVGPPGADGFHPLATVFCALELHDRVVVRDGESLSLEIVGGEVDGPLEDNLVLRAARAFGAATGAPVRAEIQLHKRVPVGGGLGGGSSDAAATLRALNRRAGAPLDRPALLRLGAGLGSDVPFFLCGSPLATGEGRGERLSPMPPLEPRPALVVDPGFAVSTAAAFRALDASRGSEPPGDPAGSLRPDTFGDWAAVAAAAVNDFEAVVLERHPVLREVLDLLRGHGAAPALLSGSGACVFGVFASDADGAAAADAVGAAHPAMRAIRTRTAAR